MNNKYSQIFEQIEEFVLHHSPSGVEDEIDELLIRKLTEIGIENWQDRAGNIIAKIKGKNREKAIAITAHKDEIGAIVKAITFEGNLLIKNLGGSFPWIYGEGVVDILGDNATITGILSFGARHVSHESPQKALQENKPLLWENSWVVTKCNLQELEAAGVRIGTRIVIGKHRKKPIRIKDYMGSFTLDNKASLAILLQLAKEIKEPEIDVYLVASSKEEVGAIGALYFTQNQKLDALIALEICPISSEYPLETGPKPVLLSQDGYGVYDEGLNREIMTAAKKAEIKLQLGVISGFGSDASIAMKFGHVSRGACLSFPTENTHGFEITHLGAINNCTEILREFIKNYT